MNISKELNDTIVDKIEEIISIVKEQQMKNDLSGYCTYQYKYRGSELVAMVIEKTDDTKLFIVKDNLLIIMDFNIESNTIEGKQVLVRISDDLLKVNRVNKDIIDEHITALGSGKGIVVSNGEDYLNEHLILEFAKSNVSDEIKFDAISNLLFKTEIPFDQETSNKEEIHNLLGRVVGFLNSETDKILAGSQGHCRFVDPDPDGTSFSGHLAFINTKGDEGIPDRAYIISDNCLISSVIDVENNTIKIKHAYVSINDRYSQFNHICPELLEVSTSDEVFDKGRKTQISFENNESEIRVDIIFGYKEGYDHKLEESKVCKDDFKELISGICESLEAPYPELDIKTHYPFVNKDEVNFDCHIARIGGSKTDQVKDVGFMIVGNACLVIELRIENDVLVPLNALALVDDYFIGKDPKKDDVFTYVRSKLALESSFRRIVQLVHKETGEQFSANISFVEREEKDPFAGLNIN